MRWLILCVWLLFCDDTLAKNKRSATVIRAFKQANPCPSTMARKGPCKGYVIDHIKALACGGADAPWNLQWQTKEQAKEKDKWERKGC